MRLTHLETAYHGKWTPVSQLLKCSLRSPIYCEMNTPAETPWVLLPACELQQQVAHVSGIHPVTFGRRG